jgi:uncharacterized membrane protein YbhN (UPF0104 family)
VTGLWEAARAVLARFGDIDAGFALAACVLHMTNHFLRSAAWRNVLGAAFPARRVRLLRVTTAYAIGVALNAVLPGRGGDAAKVALVRVGVEGSNVATIASTLSVVVLFDLVAATVLVLGVALSGSVPFAPQLALGVPDLWILIAIAAAGAVVAVAGLRLRAPLRRLWAAAQQGGAILRTPGRYVRQVVAVQAGAWMCRIGVVYCLMAAFGLDATVGRAALVMVLCGVSTLIPVTPGGAGTQQVMLTYALGHVATAAAVLSFSIGMQVAITSVNAILGLVAAMITFRTARPLAAVRSTLRTARAPA